MNTFRLTYYCLIVSSMLLALVSCDEKKTGTTFNKIEIKGPQENFTTSVNDSEIHYTHYGDGPILVALIHGWNCDQSYWSEQVEYLKDKYQLVTIDLAGHGKSSKGSREEWTMKAFGQDVINVLSNLSYDQLVLVGHSMGSTVVLNAAASLDHTNLKVVCVDYLKRPLVPLTDEVLDLQMGPMKADFKSATSAFIRNTMFTESTDSAFKEAIIEDMTSASEEVSIAMIYGMSKTDLDVPITVLNDRNIDTYVINADNTPTDTDHYEEKGFEVDIVKNTGHFLMMEKPTEFNALLDAFIQRKEA